MNARYFRRDSIIWRFSTDKFGETRGHARLIDSVIGWMPCVRMLEEIVAATDTREITAEEGEIP